MKTGLKIFVKSIILYFCIGMTTLNAQILQDTASLNLIKKGVDSIYNMQFNYPEEVYREISIMYPDHPVVIMFKGIMTYWENYPLLPAISAQNSFEEEMLRCIRLCEKNINPLYEPEYLLANLAARGIVVSILHG